jgi:hypothetical protein
VRRVPTVLAVLAIFFGIIATPALAARAPMFTKGELRPKLIQLSQLPSGWTVDNSSSSSSSNSGCFANTKHIEDKGGDVQVTANFVDGNLPEFEEEIAAGRAFSDNFAKVEKYLDRCKRTGFTVNGTVINATIGAMSFPTVGMKSAAYQVSFSVQGISVGIDFVIFQATSDIGGIFLYGNIGQPNVGQLHSFATLALKDLGLLPLAKRES